MSNHSWISVNKKTRTKDDLARVVLSELIDEEKVCYYCLMNRCNNKEHDKREQKLQRCKVFFNKLIYDPRNYSKDFETTLYKAIDQTVGKKHKIKSKSCHITSCQTSLMGRKCYNHKDGNFFKFQFEGQEFIACHKNPESCRGRLPVCVHCDFSKVNRKITMIPCKERTQPIPKKKEDKPDPVPEKKEEIKPTNPNSWAGRLNNKSKPTNSNNREGELNNKSKPTNPNSWAGKLNNKNKPSTEKNEIKEFLEEVVPFAKKQITIPINDESKDVDKSVSRLDVLERENKMLKQFISDKYEENTTSVFKKLMEEDDTRLEKLCLKVNKNRQKIIDLWEDDPTKNDDQEQSEWITA